MRPEDRFIKESPIYQGEDEQIAYKLTTTPWGSSPSNVSVYIYSVGSGGVLTDVSDTCLSGSPSTDGDVITTPLIGSLTNGTEYQLEIKFIIAGNTFETLLKIIGQH